MKWLNSLLLFVLCLGLVPQRVNAQTPAPTASPAAVAAANAQGAQYTLPPDKLAKSKALYDLRGKLLIVGLITSPLFLLLILGLGIAAKYRDWAESVSKYRFVQALIFIPLFLLTLAALDLPMGIYQQHISLQYGLSVQGWGSWFGDVLKGQLISIVVSIHLAAGLRWLISKSPRLWWFYAWLIAMPLTVFFIFLAPLVFDPLFNNFEPLDKKNPQLVDAIERVTTRAGENIPRDRIFLMNASAKVTTLNAYVTGFGASKRIVVWDTTLQNATTPETLFVVGHEMGHYVLNHIRIGIACASVGMFFGFYLAYLMANWTLARFQQRWHMRELSDWAALPMLMLILFVISTVSEPIGNNISRTLEHNADIYGLEVTHGMNPNSQAVAAHAFQVLGELSLSYPYPNRFLVFWYSDHPPICDRVPFAYNYDPWGKGKQPKYVK